MPDTQHEAARETAKRTDAWHALTAGDSTPADRDVAFELVIAAYDAALGGDEPERLAAIEACDSVRELIVKFAKVGDKQAGEWLDRHLKTIRAALDRAALGARDVERGPGVLLRAFAAAHDDSLLGEEADVEDLFTAGLIELRRDITDDEYLTDLTNKGRDAIRAALAGQSEAEAIEWWDDPDVDTSGAKGFNARYYRHLGCDEGDRPWVVPQDGAPPPSRTDHECGRCYRVLPLIPRRVEPASDH